MRDLRGDRAPAAGAGPVLRVGSEGRSSRAAGLLVGALVLAGILRFAGLDSPDFKIFDEDYYVTEACGFVTEGQRICLDITTPHPPVGKWLLAAAIWMFGPDAFGARLAPALIGTLSVGVLFLLARKLLESTWVALLAATFLAIDFLHLVMSRTAVLEVFASFFGLCALLCVVYDIEAAEGPDAPGPETPVRERRTGEIEWTRFRRRWRVLAGVFLGLAIGSKWTAAPLLVAAVGLILWSEMRGQGKRARQLKHLLRAEAPSLVVAFALIPLLVYLFSYVGRVAGELWLPPWADGSWFRAVVDQQFRMFRDHLALRQEFVGAAAPRYESAPWSWAFIRRPITFAFAIRDGTYREVLAMGNPLVWWPGTAAFAYMVVRCFRRASLLGAVLMASAFGTYLFWLLLGPGVGNVYIYYFLPAVPFLCLALAAGIGALVRSKLWRGVVAAYLAGVVASFVYFYPVLTWRPLTENALRQRLFFTDCDQIPLEGRPVVTGYAFELDDIFVSPVEAYGPDEVRGGRPMPFLAKGSGWCWF